MCVTVCLPHISLPCIFFSVFLDRGMPGQDHISAPNKYTYEQTMEAEHEPILAIIVAAVQAINNLLFDDDEEDSGTDSDEEVEQNPYFQKLKKRVFLEHIPPNRIRNYYFQVIPTYTGRQFQSHFRLSREAFNFLLNRVGGLLNNRHETGRNTVEPKKQLLIVIWLLATPESYRSVGDRFDVGKSTIFHCFVRVINVLNQLAPEFIRWPTGHYRQIVKAGFAAMRGIKNIVGIVDGTYVKIKAPLEHAENYVNRKCFYGIALQGMCDHKLKFTDCFTCFPSSVSDVRIFRNSDIYTNIVNNTNEYFPNGEFILGDKAYPVTQWCIPPYIERRPLTAVQRYFNLRHPQPRQCIERTFALYFGRFRRLRDLDMTRTDLIPATILACCVLHNVCLQYRDDFIEEYIAEGQQELGNNERLGIAAYADQAEVNEGGINKRNRIAQDLFNRRNRL